MPSSELSDALNPYASQIRQRTSVAEYSPSNRNLSFQPVVQPPQQYVPHVSELEMAIAEPPTPAPPSAQARQGAHIVAELFRIVTATQNSQEIERKRRLAWEQEQEAKVTQSQAKMEKKMQDMFNEITSLRSTVNILTNNLPAASSSPSISPQFNMSPSMAQQINPYFQPASPISPVSQHSTYQPVFVQGSSNSPLPNVNQDPYRNQICQVVRPQISQPMNSPPSHLEESPRLAVELAHQAITPDPSPQLTSLERSPYSGLYPKGKRRRKSVQPSDDESSSSNSSDSTISRPRKRSSHHDTKCYTIQHAMRNHVCSMMNIESETQLPDGHIEGNSLGPDEPVRFVWDKTTKQSVHNARMRTRILEDIMENRHIYKYVPQKEFNKKNIEAAFEQRYVTLRQKFRAQRDALAAENTKKREDHKARKARHLSRRKSKLNNRAEARLKLQPFEHVTFDGALQLECMSSEESDFEVDPVSSRPSAILRSRGYAWRSTRLLRLFSVLDEEEKVDLGTKPKRGVGRKERRVGPPMEAFCLPPQGIATWMISRRWYKASLKTYPDLRETLNKFIVDPLDFDWTDFHDLGEESTDSDDEAVQQEQEPMQTFNPHLHSTNLPLTQHTLQQNHYNPGTYMHYTL